MNTEILYIDMDNVLVDFPSTLKKLNEETLTEYRGADRRSARHI